MCGYRGKFQCLAHCLAMDIPTENELQSVTRQSHNVAIAECFRASRNRLDGAPRRSSVWPTRKSSHQPHSDTHNCEHSSAECDRDKTPRQAPLRFLRLTCWPASLPVRVRRDAVSVRRFHDSPRVEVGERCGQPNQDEQGSSPCHVIPARFTCPWPLQPDKQWTHHVWKRRLCDHGIRRFPPNAQARGPETPPPRASSPKHPCRPGIVPRS